MISDARKKLQDNLRRKFGWSTNTDYGRGCCLNKGDTQDNEAAKKTGHVVSRDKDGREYYTINDICISISDKYHSHGDKNISIYSTQYAEYAGEDGKPAYKELSKHCNELSFEELELIYQIAKQMKEEGRF